jgi:hypothetical protein
LIQLAKYETPTLCENLTEMRISSFCHTWKKLPQLEI